MVVGVKLSAEREHRLLTCESRIHLLPCFRLSAKRAAALLQCQSRIHLVACFGLFVCGRGAGYLPCVEEILLLALDCMCAGKVLACIRPIVCERVIFKDDLLFVHYKIVVC